MTTQPTARQQSGGFTLVELLVVLAILAVLATLTISAAMLAIGAAHNAAITVEVMNFDSAVKSFKNAHQSAQGLPPDGPAGAASVEAYLNSLTRNAQPPQGIDIATGASRSSDLADLGPSEALYFWLSGQALSDGKSWFDFDPTRLIDADGDGWLEYQAKYCGGTPYVYFAAAPYDSAAYMHHNGGTVRPYRSDVPLTEFAAQHTIQIIAAGQDGDFGGGAGHFPSGNGYTPADHDNITNFSEGTLENRIP